MYRNSVSLTCPLCILCNFHSDNFLADWKIDDLLTINQIFHIEDVNEYQRSHIHLAISYFPLAFVFRYLTTQIEKTIEQTPLERRHPFLLGRGGRAKFSSYLDHIMIHSNRALFCILQTVHSTNFTTLLKLYEACIVPLLENGL